MNSTFPRHLFTEAGERGAAFKQKSWKRYLGMDSYRNLTPQEAAAKMVEGEEVRVQLSEDLAALPVNTEADLLEAAVFSQARPPQELPEAQLAQDLLQLTGSGPLKAYYEGYRQSVGAYGAFNALTGELELRELSFEGNSQPIALESPDQVHQLAQFLNSGDPLLHLEEQGFQFFDGKGKAVAAFEAGGDSQARVGKKVPWIATEGASRERLTAFERHLENTGNLAAAQAALDPPEQLERLKDFVAPFAEPKIRAYLSRRALAHHSEDDLCKLLAQTTQGLAPEQCEPIFTKSFEAMTLSREPLDVLSAILEQLPPERAKAASLAALKSSDEPGPVWFLKALENLEVNLDPEAESKVIRSTVYRHRDPGAVAAYLALEVDDVDREACIRLCDQAIREFCPERHPNKTLRGINFRDQRHWLMITALEDPHFPLVGVDIYEERKMYDHAVWLARGGLQGRGNPNDLQLLKCLKDASPVDAYDGNNGYLIEAYKFALRQPDYTPQQILGRMLSTAPRRHWHHLAKRFDVVNLDSTAVAQAEGLAKAYKFKPEEARSIYAAAIELPRSRAQDLAEKVYLECPASADPTETQTALTMGAHAVAVKARGSEAGPLVQLADHGFKQKSDNTVETWRVFLDLGLKSDHLTGEPLLAVARGSLARLSDPKDQLLLARGLVDSGRLPGDDALWVRAFAGREGADEAASLALYRSFIEQPACNTDPERVARLGSLLDGLPEADSRNQLAQFALDRFASQFEGQEELLRHASEHPQDAEATFRTLLSTGQGASDPLEIELEEDGVEVGDFFVPTA